MSIVTIRDALLWCAVINYIVLLLWVLLFFTARNWFYRLHKKWFGLSEEQLNTLNYGGMIFFKLCILLLNITPYIALRIVA